VTLAELVENQRQNEAGFTPSKVHFSPRKSTVCEEATA
jgi:hypothetical protein